MSCMLFECRSLKGLKLFNYDPNKVKTNNIFSGCSDSLLKK